jgi:choline dehydrogenase-like flavoprotein
MEAPQIGDPSRLVSPNHKNTSIPNPTPSEFCHYTFDYLIIGGGTAGLVVAARLSEDPSITVGVIEAGPAAFDEAIINVPGLFGATLFTKYDWQFETVPQKGIAGKKMFWPRGKVLGGTSALNFMSYVRGNREDYDSWEELGNVGWGWDSLLPFFKKSETFSPPDASDAEKYQAYPDLDSHGTDGPLKTVHARKYADTHKYWHETLNNLNVQTNRSHLSGSNVGAWTSVNCVESDSWERSYSATAYYLPNSSRKNLVLLTEAMVREVTLEQDGGEWCAKGVRFVHGGEEFYAKASCEVIVSAGSVQSPQLLELSGIGNPEILERGGIAVKVENPNVGENLQDHISQSSSYQSQPRFVGLTASN